MKRYDLVLDPTGECDCCCLEHTGGKYVSFADHVLGISAKNTELARLRNVVKEARNYLLAKKLEWETTQWGNRTDFDRSTLEKCGRHARSVALHEFLTDFYEQRLQDALSKLEENHA